MLRFVGLMLQKVYSARFHHPAEAGRNIFQVLGDVCAEGIKQILKSKYSENTWTTSTLQVASSLRRPWHH